MSLADGQEYLYVRPDGFVQGLFIPGAATSKIYSERLRTLPLRFVGEGRGKGIGKEPGVGLSHSLNHL